MSVVFVVCVVACKKLREIVREGKTKYLNYVLASSSPLFVPGWDYPCTKKKVSCKQNHVIDENEK